MVKKSCEWMGVLNSGSWSHFTNVKIYFFFANNQITWKTEFDDAKCNFNTGIQILKDDFP